MFKCKTETSSLTIAFLWELFSTFEKIKRERDRRRDIQAVFQVHIDKYKIWKFAIRINVLWKDHNNF